MADRRITDLDPIGALATGDLFVATDANQAEIAKSVTIDTISNYVVAQVPSSARPFGSAVNQISTWAEGNNLDIIPASKLPASSVPDLSNYVTLDTTQTVTGVKNFTNLRSNNQEVVTIGNAQDITGVKTFSNPLGIQVENIVGATEMNITVDGNDILYTGTLGTFDTLTLGSGITYIDGSTSVVMRPSTSVSALTMNTSSVTFNTGNEDRDFIVEKQTSGDALRFDAGTDTLSSDAVNFEGIADQETGTWTPLFSTNGVVGTTTATYSKSGKNIILHCEAAVAAGTQTFVFDLISSSLPFSYPTTTNEIALGTYFTASTGNSTLSSTSGVVVAHTIGNISFLDNTIDRALQVDELRGFLGFTITYETTD